jgi:hypothetical protein
LKGGTYAQITGAQIASSVAGQLPLADTTQNGMLRKVSGLTTDVVDGTNNCRDLASSPALTLMRLRSYNALGNSTFECDQRNAGTALTNPGSAVWLLDRYRLLKSASLTAQVNTALTGVPTAPILLPGTTPWPVSQNYLRFTVTTSQPVLAAGDYYGFNQLIEGPRWRELSSDVHSVQLLVRSSVAALAFSLVLRDQANAHCLTKLCTIPTANTWTLVTLPNMPIWAPGGNWTCAPGSVGYNLGIYLAAGTNFTPPANDIWSNGNLFGAIGAGNFLATPGATFDICFLQHEPGKACTLPIDLPFEDNLWACKRYYQKSMPYGSIATNDQSTYVSGRVPNTATTNVMNIPDFERELAVNPPGALIYDPTSGFSGALYGVSNAGHYTVTAMAKSPKRFVNLTISPAGTAGDWMALHYTVDTGW